MGQPVVHFEVMGKDGDRLRGYYSELFGWEIDANNPMNYGTIQREGTTSAHGIGIGGGIGQTPEGYDGPRDLLRRGARRRGGARPGGGLGGARMMGPDVVTEGVEIGLFNDPEGHVVGVVKTGS